jgi:hypothetical protein
MRIGLTPERALTRDQIVAVAVAPGDARQRGARPGEFARHYVHQRVDARGLGGRRLDRDPVLQLAEQLSRIADFRARHENSP